MERKFKPGDEVEYNGIKEARILDYYTDTMVTVRVWFGLRHVGDVCVSESEVRKISQ